MIALTTSTAQVIPVGGSILFDTVIASTGCQCHRRSSATVKLVKRGFHIVRFAANIGSNTAETDAIAVIRDSGDNILGSEMITVSQAAGDLNNVSATTVVNNCCGDYGRISVVNAGTTPMNVGAGATLVISEM